MYKTWNSVSKVVQCTDRAAAHAPEQIILHEKIVLYDKNENNSEIPEIINGVCKKFQGAAIPR